jgi:hypothetical protein
MSTNSLTVAIVGGSRRHYSCSYGSNIQVSIVQVLVVCLQTSNISLCAQLGFD